MTVKQSVKSFLRGVNMRLNLLVFIRHERPVFEFVQFVLELRGGGFGLPQSVRKSADVLNASGRHRFSVGGYGGLNFLSGLLHAFGKAFRSPAQFLRT
ncbi:MAG: hypothetical protein IJG24_02595, partial [Selenomonadaceae bacterium]|nr:hypothetical protein [Selenomonadaceae bacterium]